MLLGSVMIWIASFRINAQRRRGLNFCGLWVGRDALRRVRFSNVTWGVPPLRARRSGTLPSLGASASLFIFSFIIESIDQLDERLFHCWIGKLRGSYALFQ